MSNSNPEIRARLDALELDRAGAVDSFSRRLARENRWSATHTARVILEYKRFLLLASSSDRLISPSDAVDQAWHLHLLYTRDYRRVCRTILGRRLEHTPSQGGHEERAKFEEAYARTLEVYLATFGEEPPPEVWPSVAERFGGENEFVRVDVNAHYVLPKPRLVRALSSRLKQPTTRSVTVFVALAAMVLVGCATRGTGVGTLTGPAFLTWFLVVWAASVLAAYAVREQLGTAPSAPAPELDAYEAAYLANGATAAVDSGIAVLVATGAAAFDAETGTLLATRPVAPGAHGLEIGVHALLREDAPMEMRTIRARAAELTSAMAQRLKDLELITDRPSYLPLGLALVAPLVGAVRIGTRIGTDRPIAFLVFLTVIATAVALGLFWPSQRTRAGEAKLRELKARHATLPYSSSAPELASQGALPLAIGLFGIGFLASGSELGGLSGWLSKRRPSSGDCGGGCGAGGCGDDGGSSCGGGGCGGGCGGCGGCGGE
jgi:uncharacterized protein (TIGR04222 family)